MRSAARGELILYLQNNGPCRPIRTDPKPYSKAVLSELPEHPLGIYAELFSKRSTSKPKPVDPITHVSEGITPDGREVVYKWRGRPC